MIFDVILEVRVEEVLGIPKDIYGGDVDMDLVGLLIHT